MTVNNASSKTSAVRYYGNPDLITKDWERDSVRRAERQRLQEAYREEAKAAGTYGQPTPETGKARKGVSH